MTDKVKRRDVHPAQLLSHLVTWSKDTPERCWHAHNDLDIQQLSQQIPAPREVKEGKRHLDEPNHQLGPQSLTHGTYATATSSACIALFPHTPPLLTQQITSSSCFISNSLTVPQLLACTLVLPESKCSRLQEKTRAPGLSAECDLVLELWEKSCLQTLGPWPMSHRVFFENLAERSLPC